MADIFLSYTHDDRDRVRPLVDLLEREGWLVWWDRVIEPGKPWRDELNATLAKVRAVVVVWSEHSVDSEWVQYEAQTGVDMDALVPVRIGDVVPPTPFADLQAVDISRLRAEAQTTEGRAFLRRLGRLVPPSNIETVRPGYDSEFLGEGDALGLPGVTGTAAVLRYLHFTVVMNPARRLAHYVAYNMDGASMGRAPRGHDWQPDPLLPTSLQMEMETLKKSDYDRGHLVARSHVMWGDPRQVMIASRQAFYWPNISPQFKQLNRSWWLALERWEKAIAVERGRAAGFSGVVFTDEDEPFRGEVELEDGVVARDSFRIPRGYWKVLFAKDSDGLQHAAYYLDQAKLMSGDAAPPKRPEDCRIALTDLETLAQVRFGEAHHRAGPLP